MFHLYEAHCFCLCPQICHTPSHFAPTQKQRAVTRQSKSIPVIRKGPLVEFPHFPVGGVDEEIQALESVYDEGGGPLEVFKMREKTSLTKLYIAFGSNIQPGC